MSYRMKRKEHERAHNHESFLLQTSPLKEQLEWTGEELQRGITRAREEYCNTYVLL